METCGVPVLTVRQIRPNLTYCLLLVRKFAIYWNPLYLLWSPQTGHWQRCLVCPGATRCNWAMTASCVNYWAWKHITRASLVEVLTRCLNVFTTTLWLICILLFKRFWTSQELEPCWLCIGSETDLKCLWILEPAHSVWGQQMPLCLGLELCFWNKGWTSGLEMKSGVVDVGGGSELSKELGRSIRLGCYDWGWQGREIFYDWNLM